MRRQKDGGQDSDHQQEEAEAKRHADQGRDPCRRIVALPNRQQAPRLANKIGKARSAQPMNESCLPRAIGGCG